MNTKLFSLTIFAVASALVFGLGSVKTTMADDSYNYHYDEVNLFGVDEATSSAGLVADRDEAAPGPVFDIYGLHGTLGH